MAAMPVEGMRNHVTLILRKDPGGAAGHQSGVHNPTVFAAISLHP